MSRYPLIALLSLGAAALVLAGCSSPASDDTPAETTDETATPTGETANAESSADADDAEEMMAGDDSMAGEADGEPQPLYVTEVPASADVARLAAVDAVPDLETDAQICTALNTNGGPVVADGPFVPQIPQGEFVATFAGGCFWCVEKPFESIDGVISVVSGFAGGTTDAPTYQSHGDHVEAVQVRYDASKVEFTQLLDIYWRAFNPTDGSGQFADRGRSYEPVLFFHSAEQQRLAEQSKNDLLANDTFHRIMVPIEPATRFWPVAEYHQDYYKKNPEAYDRYYRGSGRKRFLDETWGADR